LEGRSRAARHQDRLRVLQAASRRHRALQSEGNARGCMQGSTEQDSELHRKGERSRLLAAKCDFAVSRFHVSRRPQTGGRCRKYYTRGRITFLFLAVIHTDPNGRSKTKFARALEPAKLRSVPTVKPARAPGISGMTEPWRWLVWPPRQLPRTLPPVRCCAVARERDHPSHQDLAATFPQS
jgi:hypothetical protein